LESKKMGFRDYLTKKSDYLINWQRAGSLFFSGTHRYTPKEVLERSFVITSMAVGGFLKWNTSNNGGATPFMFGAALGFLVSHSITMSPLIYKRLEAKWACGSLKDTIHLRLIAKPEECRLLVTSIIEKILKETHSKSPSAVWGRRKRLLTNLLEWLNNSQLSLKELTDKLQSPDVITHLDKKNKPEPMTTDQPSQTTMAHN
jgi:hypothetical protein